MPNACRCLNGIWKITSARLSFICFDGTVRNKGGHKDVRLLMGSLRTGRTGVGLFLDSLALRARRLWFIHGVSVHRQRVISGFSWVNAHRLWDIYGVNAHIRGVICEYSRVNAYRLGVICGASRVSAQAWGYS